MTLTNVKTVSGELLKICCELIAFACVRIRTPADTTAFLQANLCAESSRARRPALSQQSAALTHTLALAPAKRATHLSARVYSRSSHLAQVKNANKGKRILGRLCCLGRERAIVELLSVIFAPWCERLLNIPAYYAALQAEVSILFQYSKKF